MSLPQIPEQAGNDTLETLFDIAKAEGRELDEKAARLFGNDLDLAKATAAAMDRISSAMKPKLHEIDLRGKNLDVRFEFHGKFRGKQQWTAWDERNYTGDESPMGEGESKEDALADLLEKTAAEAANGEVNFDRDLEDQIDDALHNGDGK